MPRTKTNSKAKAKKAKAGELKKKKLAERRTLVAHMYAVQKLSMTAIAEELQMSRHTVRDICERHSKTGTTDRKQGSGRKPTRTDKDDQDKVAAIVQKTPAANCRRIANEIGSDRCSAWRMMGKIGKKSARAVTAQALTAAQKKKRAQMCAKWLAELDLWETLQSEQIVFTDEKFFRLPPPVGASFAPNPSDKGQNSRIWIDVDTPKKELPTSILVKGVKQREQGVMAHKAICLRGHIGIHVVAEGVKVNSDCYVDLLRDHLIPRIGALFPSFCPEPAPLFRFFL